MSAPGLGSQHAYIKTKKETCNELKKSWCRKYYASFSYSWTICKVRFSKLKQNLRLSKNHIVSVDCIFMLWLLMSSLTLMVTSIKVSLILSFCGYPPTILILFTKYSKESVAITLQTHHVYFTLTWNTDCVFAGNTLIVFKFVVFNQMDDRITFNYVSQKRCFTVFWRFLLRIFQFFLKRLTQRLPYFW